MDEHVPELRFDNFTEKWRTNKLIDLAENGFSNGVFNDKHKAGSGYKLINVKDMYIGSEIDIDSLTLLSLDKKEFNKNKANYGDIFFTRSSIVPSGIAYSNVNLSQDDDITFDGHLMKMVPNTELLNSIYLFYSFKNERSRKQFIARGKVSTMTTIGQEDIASVLVQYPSLKEQQKIADFLSSIDNKIRVLTEKQSLLKLYKKSVMQKLFSQELRFKQDDGTNYPDWENKLLEELNLTVSDGNYGEMYPKASQMKDNGVPFIRANNIKNLRVVWKDMKFISEDLHKVLKSGHLRYRDILVTTRGDIGMLAYVNKEFDNSNINAQICLLRCGKGVSQKYLLNFLSSDLGQKQFKRLQSGSALKQLPKGRLAKVKVKLPPFLEQQKIANFLSEIDKKIDSVTQQIEQTKTFKKGLLQQMFV